MSIPSCSSASRRPMCAGRTILAAALALASIACHPARSSQVEPRRLADMESCADTSTSSGVPVTIRDSLPPRDPRRAPDYFFTTLALELPGGFGGFHGERLPDRAARHRGGAPPIPRFVVRLQDTTLTPAMRDTLFARLRGFYGPELVLTDVRLLSSRWNFAQLDEWWRYLTPQLMRMRAVHMAAIDARHNRLGYWVLTDSARIATRALLRRLDVPCGLVEIDVGPMASIGEGAGAR